jgi:deazaflavin-dependent oxidoreductase (nitroreductase family)
MWLPYPEGAARWLLRSPVLLYRLGLGALANRVHIMILVTRGRTSGLPRYTPVEYRAHGSKTYILSGWGERAHWVQNLRAQPSVVAQQGGAAFGACAEIVTNEGEALRALRLFRRPAPSVYDAVFARMTERDKADEHDLIEIARRVTIIRLDPQAVMSDLPPLQSDLGWVLPALSVGMVALWVVGRIAARGSKQ